jgi:hypothetical protein
MKTKNVIVLMLIVIASALTAGFGTMPNSIVDFLGAFAVSFIFWFLLCLGAFDFEKERDYSKDGWNEKFNR